MFEIKETKWIIMDKARTVIAKGVTRDRHLVSVKDVNDKKRVLYYSSAGMAKAGYSTGFYTFGLPKDWREYDLEPVKVELIIREK
jgi:hypothetical protein